MPIPCCGVLQRIMAYCNLLQRTLTTIAVEFARDKHCKSMRVAEVDFENDSFPGDFLSQTVCRDTVKITEDYAAYTG
jgi:hypothetical protein